MRTLILTALIVTAIFTSSFAAEAKSLVVVFSRTDENYNVGYITKGNTMILAEMIASKTGSDLFEIKPEKKYPADYDTCIDVAKKELNAKARPAILEDKDVSEYDTVYFGYPIWWGDLPMCFYTFIEGHDWNGKKIIPFCTHEGSGLAGTERKLKSALKGAEVMKGLAVRGSTAQNDKAGAEKAIDSWLKSLGM
ncbi:MAG: flavodoxin [Synergistaceae bacterium]|nr:flavodoxin [Synergistaceae bacterium]MBQ3449497.1 flavodoxin [Synergistaceae bacterium]MBQ3694248.1 flavodoxin [Synergistaceae bacterium]MBQ6110926.1 flavodoxin [Synergistaceae bacterium]MBQ9628200.1 flavodoxin [Synergistaceae bacterium]